MTWRNQIAKMMTPLDALDEDEKKIVNYLINSLENKYDKNTFEALRFELKKKDLLRAKGRIG
jgi:hypothetical protein